MPPDDENDNLDQRPRSGDRPSLLVYNERIKYTATWLNTIAAGAIVVGVVAPLTAWAMGGAIGPSILISLGWLPVGAGIHFLSRLLLARLKEEERFDDRN